MKQILLLLLLICLIICKRHHNKNLLQNQNKNVDIEEGIRGQKTHKNGEYCSRACVPKKCTIPLPYKGECDDYQIMYYYNSNTKQCVQFTWGGNKCPEYIPIDYNLENRFCDISSCQASCQRSCDTLCKFRLRKK